MKSRPLITVAIAVYNTEKYLKDCMESVVNQTYRNLEIICVNDASTDSSFAILESYALQDSRIKIITNSKNSGLGVTRNVGMDAAQGEYILFVDSDDWIDLTTCEKLITKALENDAEIVFYGAWQVEGEQRKRMPNHCEVSYPLTTNDRKTLLEKTLPSTWSKLWKREFMRENKIRFPDFRRAQDQLPHWIVCLKSEKIIFSTDLFYNYRTNETQVSKSGDERLVLIVDVFDGIEKWLKDEGQYNFYKKYFLRKKVSNFILNYLKMNESARHVFKKRRLFSISDILYYLFKMKTIKRKLLIFVIYSNFFEFMFVKWQGLSLDKK